MNFHNDEWIMNGVKNHYNDLVKEIPEDRVVGVFLQGSQNYGLDYEGSDIDTKAIIIPSFSDIVFNRSPISTTKIRDNEEHIDIKDLRLYFKLFEAQNINFLEVLFTPYFIVNHRYELYWSILLNIKEKVARYDEQRFLRAALGLIDQKLHALKHPYPSKLALIEKYGYDGKQLHHIVRLKEIIERYINGEKFETLLIARNPEYLLELKRNKLPLKEAEELALYTAEGARIIVNDYIKNNSFNLDEEVCYVKDTVQYAIMESSVRSDIM